MHNDPICLLKPVFDWLDGLIPDQGDCLYVLLVYVSIPLVAWILSGGLRRRLPRQTNLTAIILIYRQHRHRRCHTVWAMVTSHLMFNRSTREPTDHCRQLNVRYRNVSGPHHS